MKLEAFNPILVSHNGTGPTHLCFLPQTVEFSAVAASALGLALKVTTAARPTFEPARGRRGKGEGDLPSHTKIKYKQATQDAPEEVRN